jgi:hypothetical protein
MNKTFDERIVPDGEYIDAMNIRMGSTEKSEAGAVENTVGNLPLTALQYLGIPLSPFARCIGAIEDSARETLYWFVHDPNFGTKFSNKIDLIVSYNISTLILTYHVISLDDGTGVGNTTLNFNPTYLITGVNIIEDLLFWTDDYNEPRFINVKRNYANPDGAGIDYNGSPDILKEELLVIKKPPTEAPTLQLLELAGQENYLEERFICFAYRYKYADGEYSATSQWSDIAFSPNPFIFSNESFLNEGMTNQYNGVDITFNTGGPLVVGIDLLFKAANGNIIKVIEKFDKQNSGWSDNTLQTYTFLNSKIFTILPESELLRLYDNVPRLAKAQTIMGNRLMYGNYVDGYDLVDANGTPVQFTYQTELVSIDFTSTDLITSTSDGIYSISGSTIMISNSVLYIDLSNQPLLAGNVISVSIVLEGYYDNVSTAPVNQVSTSFNFPINSDYTSVYQLATSTEFVNFIGTALNIQTNVSQSLTPNSCDGTTVTDIINCDYNQIFTIPNPPNPPDVYRKNECGIDAIEEPIRIIASPTSNLIGLQFLATQYVKYPTTTTFEYVYYKIIQKSASIFFNYGLRSLHSNRDYEIGIVYMDEFNRATPANVSSSNTVHVPCSYSPFSNSITVNIPPTQIAPYWAKRYKFVCKADMAGYETIYSNIWFTGTDGNIYFLLQGENARKVEEGDRYIVKADTDGPTTSCVYATVLEKKSYASGDISATPPINPAGVYMKINVENFNITKSSNAIISFGRRQQTEGQANVGPILSYPMSYPDPLSPGNFIAYSVPAGSVIVFDIKFERRGYGDKPCETRIYTLNKTYVSSSNYTDMKDWFNGDNIASTINDGIQDIGGSNCPANNVYISTNGILSTYSLCDNYWQFYENISTGELVLQLSGTTACSGDNNNKRKSRVIANITVFRAVDNIVFETMPQDTLPDVFFENDLSFPIDVKGNHLSNGAFGDVSQDIGSGIYGVIQTGFFNCFAFGNGVESYKIRDSIVGRDFNLGNRVTTVAAQDYREERRFADITYSGVYNPETNVNKLNEFNSGLLNYKNLELSFGAIYILDGRETDVLTIQEDKVSYVLAGKNLLSDAAAGGAITSVPEVLGTQIARTEKYGISFNPESYVQWGYDRFFTDAKRGAVIQLRGNSYSNDQLTVISEQNMRTWFRDTFNGSFNTQKLGGFDPYMNEYVLTTNDIDLPFEQECIKCGVNQTLTFAQGEIKTRYNYCVNLGSAIGKTVVEWNVISIDPDAVFNIIAIYDGNSYDSGSTNTSGSFDFFKYAQNPNNVEIYILVGGNVVIDINVRCPEKEPATLVEVVLTNDSDAGKSLMKQFNYVNGSYTSPLQSNFFIFSSGTGNPLVSYYLVTNGFVGQGNIPPEGATMTLQTNETFPYVTFDFNPLVHKFRYARDFNLYGNNDIDMQALLAISSVATPILNPITGIYNASFTVPPSVNGQYVYIIWDLRTATEVQLCTSDNLEAVCCDCKPCEEECSTYVVSNPDTALEMAIIEFPNGLCGAEESYIISLGPGESDALCLVNAKNLFVILQGNPVVYMLNCFCKS